MYLYSAKRLNLGSFFIVGRIEENYVDDVQDLLQINGKVGSVFCATTSLRVPDLSLRLLKWHIFARGSGPLGLK